MEGPLMLVNLARIDLMLGRANDALDQLACNHPDTPQAYRFAMCGKGDPNVCLNHRVAAG